jgi:hypothetical protein
MTLRTHDRITPGGRLSRIPGEEVSQLVEIEGVISREAPDPRKAADIEGEPCGRAGNG